MMINTKTLYARAGAAAIAAALALSPTLAAPPKPIVDLSASPAVSGKPAPTAAKPAAPVGHQIGPVKVAGATVGPISERTAEFGGGALALVILGGVALAMRSRKRRREDEQAWQYHSHEQAAPQPEHDSVVPDSHLPQREAAPIHDSIVDSPAAQPMAEEQPPIVAPSIAAFAWGEEKREETASDCADKETWMERAKCGPTPDNPSMSVKKRVKRAAFFEQREREVAEGDAVPVDPDAGLPENLEELESQQERA